MVVEDDKSSQRLMGFFLRDKYELCFTESVAGAREILKRGKINMILLDLSLLGDENGLDLVRFLRATAKWVDLPIIATTAHAFQTDRAECMDAGCNGFIAKPISRDKLVHAIKTLIE